MNAKDQLVTWLQDAHAMETGLVPILENHARDADGDPGLGRQLRAHAEQTRRHAELVRECLQQLGSDVSSVKSGFASVMGTVESFSTKFFGDVVLKNMLMDYASEHFEIACYRALVEAATQAGEAEIAKTCTSILTEEENMAEWLRQNLGVVTRSVLARTATAR